MAETETSPGNRRPWAVMTQREGMSRVHNGGALCGEVQKKRAPWTVEDAGRSASASKAKGGRNRGREWLPQAGGPGAPGAEPMRRPDPRYECRLETGGGGWRTECGVPEGGPLVPQMQRRGDPKVGVMMVAVKEES